MVHGHNVGQWVKTTDLRFKTDSESVIFTDGPCYVHGPCYVYHWKFNRLRQKCRIPSIRLNFLTIPIIGNELDNYPAGDSDCYEDVLSFPDEIMRKVSRTEYCLHCLH